MLHQAPCQGKGGVAILVREPVAVMEKQRFCTQEGQSLTVRVFGCQRSFLLTVLYRPPKASFDVLNTCNHLIAADPNNQEWILAMDGNSNMIDQVQGPIPDLMESNCGILQATARHDASRYPIDGIWSSSVFRHGQDLVEIPWPGDHSIAIAYMACTSQKGPIPFRFAHPPKFMDPPAEVSSPD